MIEIVDVTKKYRGKTAVDRVSFTARPGRVTGFLGPNGAGKSTTLRVLLGLDRPTSGTALIDGKPREEENWAWLRALARFEGIWEFAALYCPHR